MASREIKTSTILENPSEEVNAVGALTRIALSRSEVGEMQGKSRVVYLKDSKDKVVYKLVKEIPSDREGVYNVDKINGLILYGIRIDNDVRFEDRDFWLNLPLDINLIDESLAERVVSEIALENVNGIAESLNRSTTLSANSFEEAFSMHVLRQRRDADNMRLNNS